MKDMSNENLEQHHEEAFWRCPKRARKENRCFPLEYYQLFSRSKLVNKTLEKLVKIFPELKISFSPYDRKSIMRRYYSEVEDQLWGYFKELTMKKNYEKR